MSKIGVIGAGKWGSALAFALSEKNEVYISSRTPRDMKNFIPMQEILKFDYLVIAIPAQQISSWLEDNFIFSHQKVLVAAKGIE
ncbi:MAG: NAD(P)-binding domain-containing protein, partial [Sulfurimonas sp.]|nr:NAD(P)-binding domain-containing protein [Sulfurimonas sp.]